MSAISSIRSTVAAYKPIVADPAKPKTVLAPVPKAPPAGNDPDHDGDTDGSGVDVKG